MSKLRTKCLLKKDAQLEPHLGAKTLTILCTLDEPFSERITVIIPCLFTLQDNYVIA